MNSVMCIMQYRTGTYVCVHYLYYIYGYVLLTMIFDLQSAYLIADCHKHQVYYTMHLCRLDLETEDGKQRISHMQSSAIYGMEF